MENIIGTNDNDTLVGSYDADTINGLAGNDTITGNQGDDTLTGGGGNDQFVVNNGTDTITDFAGVGKGTNPAAAVIAEVDTLKFDDNELLSARNLLLTQNGSNLEITFKNFAFENFEYEYPLLTKVILQNFKLENLENLKASGVRPAIGNILFYGQTSITDSFNVLDANSTDTSLGIKNTVTFLNDLSNNIVGLDDSDDVVNGQGGNDKIDGKSGNDFLRSGTGNDTLIGGVGKDTLIGSKGNNSLVGGAGDDTLRAEYSKGNSTLNGGTGNDDLIIDGSTDNYLLFGASTGDNLLNGGDGNDNLTTLSFSGISGNNTLNGGTGNDELTLFNTTGNNLFNGGNGNDYIRVYGYKIIKSGSNTLIGGVGNDTLTADYTTGNNLVNGGDGNDYLSAGGSLGAGSYEPASGNNTLNGGAGDDNLNTYFSKGNNLLDGGDGNDKIYVGSSKDTINGGTGDDLLSYNSIYTYYNLTEGIISTFNASTNIGAITSGTNRISYKFIEQLDITGTQYDDLIVGSNGNDTLSGGQSGNDTLIGGAGIDTFAFNNFNEGVDILYDFNATNELIQVRADSFAGELSSGTLETNNFTIGASATINTQRFIYNSTTGGLFFDLDGSASGFTQVQFAQLNTGVALTKDNFVVV